MRQVVIPTALARTPALAPAGQCVELTGECMGTTWQVRVHAAGVFAGGLRATIEAELALIVRQMSHWEPDSDLSRFNRAAPDSLVVLPEPLFGLLRRARRIAAASGGAFDPTAGMLVRRWGFGPDRLRLQPDFRIPDQAEAAMLRDRCGWQRLQLEPATRHAYQPGGLELDLSAIAKGFAVDQISQQLLRLGFSTHLVEIGGELRGAGLKPDAQPWWVSIEPPAADASLDETLIALCDHAVATSGDYRFTHVAGDQRYAHTVDPRTGLPAGSELAAVTVISDECWHADALSTALMVMGIEEGLAFADQRDIAARFILRTGNDLREQYSATWAGMLR